MEFINRRDELDKIQNEYKQHLKTGKSQVYIIRANSGIGKSEFIKEIIKDWKTEYIENRIIHLEKQGANLDNCKLLKALDKELERRDRQEIAMLGDYYEV